MKKFSKVLCLVLVLAMMAGLCCFGTGAAYADADKINYKEAVDVLSATGVLQGDENGFRPQDGLKRAEACKIIAYLCGAEDLTGTCKFTDCKGHWAANYIAYCAAPAQGYVEGVGGNKFNPDGALTGSAFAKMLLGVLGYKASIEGMTGADWEIAVAKLVKTTKLAAGLAKFDGTKAITREEAAQLALNALKTTMVTYEGGASVSINNVKIETSSDREEVKGTGAYSYAIDGEKGQENTIQLGEALYAGKLVKTGGQDNYGRKNYTITYKGEKVGTYYYGNESELVYTTTVTEKALKADLKANGYTATDKRIANVVAGAKNGIETKLSFDADGVCYRVRFSDDAIIAAADITKSLPVAETKTKGAYVTYKITDESEFAGTYYVFSSVVDEDADKDTVIIEGTVDGKKPVLVYTDEAKKVHICEMETVTGTVTSKKTVNSATTYTIDGEAYVVSAVTDYANTPVTIDLGAKEVGFYLDRFGNLAYNVTAAAAPVYFTLGWKDVNTLEDDNTILTTRYAMLADTTGAVQQFKIAADATPALGKLVVTGTPDEGVYTLSEDISSADVTFKAVKGIVAKSTTLMNNSWTAINKFYATEKTLFVFAGYKNSSAVTSNFTTSTVTGISEVGSYGTSGDKLDYAWGVDTNNDNIVDVVFVGDNVAANAVTKLAYLTGNYDVVEKKTAGYTVDYEAYVDGVLDTITIKSVASGDVEKVAGLYEYTAISAELATTDKMPSGKEIKKIENVGGLLKVTGPGEGTYVYNEYEIAGDCPIYAINGTDKTVNAYAFKDITAMECANAYIINGTGAKADTIVAVYFTIR